MRKLTNRVFTITVAGTMLGLTLGLAGCEPAEDASVAKFNVFTHDDIFLVSKLRDPRIDVCLVGIDSRGALGFGQVQSLEAYQEVATQPVPNPAWYEAE